MAAYVPITFTRGGATEVAKTLEDYWQFVWDGWAPSTVLPGPDPLDEHATKRYVQEAIDDIEVGPGGGEPYDDTAILAALADKADADDVAAALAGKASTAHGHAISDVTGLQAALDGKVPGQQITQAAYDALGTGRASKLYVIVG